MAAFAPGTSVFPARLCRTRLVSFVFTSGQSSHFPKGSSMITISAFRWVPPQARGQVRDLRARWALEEAGIPYQTRLLDQGEQDSDAYRALQPFGQVPIL